MRVGASDAARVLALRGLRQDARRGPGQSSVPATAYKTIGRRFSAFNSLGSLVIQYTIWQEFGYNGTWSRRHRRVPTGLQ